MKGEGEDALPTAGGTPALQTRQNARPSRHARDLANRPFGSFPIWNSFVFQNF